MKIIKGNKYILIVVLMTTFVMMSSPIDAISNNENTGNTSNIVHITYKSLVDQDYGFYRVTDIITHKPAPYENNTLTIYVGDIVIWENDATPDEPLTIISKQGLWENRYAYLRWNYQKFSYTFNQSGTYTVYIKEYPREQYQTIIVNDVPGTIEVTPISTVTLTVIPTVTLTVSPTDNIPSANSERTNSIPIEAIIAIAGLIVLIVYISRKKK